MCWHGPKLRTAVAAVATREAFGSSQSSFDSLRADAESVDLRHNEEGSTIIAECLCRKQPKHGNGAAKVAGSVRNFGDLSAVWRCISDVLEDEALGQNRQMRMRSKALDELETGGCLFLSLAAEFVLKGADQCTTALSADGRR